MNFIVEYGGEIIVALLSSSTIYFYQKLKQYKKMMNATKKGVQALLRSEIIKKYIEYRKNGCTSIHDQEIINELYEEYKTLGGNGVIDKLVQEIAEMEVDKCTKGGE